MAGDVFVDASTAPNQQRGPDAAKDITAIHTSPVEPNIDSQHHKTAHEAVGKVAQKTIEASKRLLHLPSRNTHEIHTEHSGVQDVLSHNAAFNQPAQVDDAGSGLARSAQRRARKVKNLANVVIHPKSSAKRKAAKVLAVCEQPYLSRQSDQALMDAHESLRNLQDVDDDASENSNAMGKEATKEMAKRKELEGRIDDIKSQRQATSVAWTSARFVKRVRVVDCARYQRPRVEEYEEEDGDGGKKVDWVTYVGHRMRFASQRYAAQYIDDIDTNLPTFDNDVLLRHVERLIMASAPWQTYYVSLRQLARWDDPRRTARWFIAWILVWYVDRVFTFMWAYIIFIVLKQRFFSGDIDSLKESHRRAAGRDATAQRFSEMIKRHGTAGWLTPMTDQIGPYAQIQVGDFADWLEILQNFHDWKYPQKTVETLLFWFACIMLGNFASTAFAMRAVTSMTILWFFLLRPVASRFPRYRQVVSPSMWIFWDIPTHAQSSFRYLRRNAQVARKTAVEAKVEEKHPSTNPHEILASQADAAFTSGFSVSELNEQSLRSSRSFYHDASAEASISLDDTGFISFSCSWEGTEGRLVVTASGLRFVSQSTSKLLWDRPYEALVEIRKYDNSLMMGGKSECLEIEFKDGYPHRMESVSQRDEAVNSIIGFSALRWQLLQPRPEKQAMEQGVVNRPQTKIRDLIGKMT